MFGFYFNFVCVCENIDDLNLTDTKVQREASEDGL